MKNKLVLLMLLALPISACSPNISPDSYGVGAVGKVNRAVKGEIISVRQVNIEGTKSGIGSGSGAASGAIAGSYAGGDSGSAVIATIGGAVIGGVIGAATEDSITKQTGYEYVVETTTSALITVVQGGEIPFKIGQPVLVMYGSRARIIPLANKSAGE